MCIIIYGVVASHCSRDIGREYSWWRFWVGNQVLTGVRSGWRLHPWWRSIEVGRTSALNSGPGGGVLK